MPTAWADVLGALLDNATHLKASKACRKALKAAAATSSKSAEALEASLHKFLRKGEGGFKLEDGKVVRTAVQNGTVAAPAAAAAGKKSSKKQQMQQQTAPAEPPPPQPQQQLEGEPSGKKEKKKKGKKKRSAPEELQPAQDVQQPPAAAAEQQQPEPPAKKKRRKGAAGSVPLVTSVPVAEATPPAAADAAADGGGAGEGATSWQPAASGWDPDDADVAEVRWRDDQQRQAVKSGPFSKAEKDTLRQAVVDYAAAKGLPTDDMSWLFSTSKSGATKGMWKKIASKLPHRTAKSVWAAGTRLFHEGNYQGKWTPQEDDQLLNLVAERGRRWKEIGGAVGRMPESCRDRYLAIRLGAEQKKGRWGEEEEGRLRAAVEEYMAAKAAAEGADAAGGEATLTLADIQGGEAAVAVGEGGRAVSATDRRVILDDIDWNVISLAVGSRSNIQCLEKWYTQLSPSMVARGDWGPGDDRRLLKALFQSGAAAEYELEWGQLVRGRGAAAARRRWRLMLKALPDHRDMDFGEQVDELVERYLPQLKAAQQEQQQQQQQQQQQDGSDE